MTLQLPENFHLPSGAVYDGLINELHQEIEAEGSASLYLGKVRSKRRESESFGKVLRSEAWIALLMEERDSDGMLDDPAHKLANTALSGMLFGHFLNEKHYPYLNAGINPYTATVKTSFLGDYTSRYFALGSVKTATGLRFGFSVMAETQLSQLSDESAQRIYNWSEDVIVDRRIRPSFHFGIGYSLFQTWQTYQRIMIEQGSFSETDESDELAQNNRGDGTSI